MERNTPTIIETVGQDTLTAAIRKGRNTLSGQKR